MSCNCNNSCGPMSCTTCNRNTLCDVECRTIPSLPNWNGQIGSNDKLSLWINPASGQAGTYQVSWALFLANIPSTALVLSVYEANDADVTAVAIGSDTAVPSSLIGLVSGNHATPQRSDLLYVIGSTPGRLYICRSSGGVWRRIL